MRRLAWPFSDPDMLTCTRTLQGNTKSCDHDMDAGVCCLGPGKPPPRKAPGPKWPCAGDNNRISSGATRLVECTKGGCRLEIKHNDEWGTVCSQDWKDDNAAVACRSSCLSYWHALVF